MTLSRAGESVPDGIYHIMSDQPDCCPKCQRRLDLFEIVMIDHERVFVNFCEDCEREILFVED